MVRLMGSCLIIVSCGMVGIILGRNFTKRRDDLRMMQYGLQLLETEIFYLSTPLPEAMNNVSQQISGHVGEIFFLVGKKMKTVLIVDEASLLRLDVFSELHTICQFDQDSKPYLPLILAGQNNLVDKLLYRDSQPLASRIVARSHLEGINRHDMEQYLRHHLAVAGVKKNLFDQAAVTAIHQGSGGLFRKANHLARGALIAAAADQAVTVSPEHVRIAATELF